MSARGVLNRIAARRPRLDEGARAAHPNKSVQLDRAIMGLAKEHPHLSAREVVTPAQLVVVLAFLITVATAFPLRPEQTVNVAVAAMSIGFLYSLALRFMLALWGRRVTASVAPATSGDLPIYTILVPVYREAGMIPQMARALAALDYPVDKLDICLVVEEDDGETRAAVRAAGLHAVVVPPARPRTKPKACNFALQFARGEFVVVYDAEDRPEPDQLRKAVAAFRAMPDVSCFQARLAIDRTPTWLSKMFAVEYDVWFRTLLPGLARLRAPIPLGGTSNHFRTRALIEAGAWDPFNVTEDADLGVRLARFGHCVAILDSTTYEEAPNRTATWLRQRTRWTKGYMQTLLVHTRNPRLLMREITPLKFILTMAVLGGGVWSALVNPLMWLVCAAGALLAHGVGAPLELLARVSGATLLVANILLAALAMMSGGRRRGETVTVLTFPLYWMLISAASYRALWQLLRDPFHWEKTAHGAAGQ